MALNQSNQVFISEVTDQNQLGMCSGVEEWIWALAAAWVTSPLFCFAAFVVMYRFSKVSRSDEPFIIQPSSSAARAAVELGSRSTMRVVSLNMCLLPGGLSFSGCWLFDGDDKKSQRVDMLIESLDECDVLLLNEMWGCWWSSYHETFFRRAVERGFHVCASPVGLLMDSGNVIVSRYPLSSASLCTFKNASGWQSIVPNGILHAMCTPPSGIGVHLFTTHLQCTSAPTDDMKKLKPADRDDECDDGCFSGMVRAIGKVESDREAVQRLEQLHELGHFVRLTAGARGHYVIGGDFNIAGGSNDYNVATKIFGRESANAPEFKATYTTRSFLTPPGWKDVLWEANLDHMFTNLDICEFEVKEHIDISDHLPMRLVVSQPRQVEIIEHIEHRFKIRSGLVSFATRCVCSKTCQGPCAKHNRISLST